MSEPHDPSPVLRGWMQPHPALSSAGKSTSRSRACRVEGGFKAVLPGIVPSCLYFFPWNHSSRCLMTRLVKVDRKGLFQVLTLASTEFFQSCDCVGRKSNRQLPMSPVLFPLLR